MSQMVRRTMSANSIGVVVVISPATTTRPVVISVSQATREFGSPASAASRMASEIWSAILSGCPSVTDSEVNRCSLSASGIMAVFSFMHALADATAAAVVMAFSLARAAGAGRCRRPQSGVITIRSAGTTSSARSMRFSTTADRLHVGRA